MYGIGCSIALLLVRILHGFGGLLCLPETAPDNLAAFFVLSDRRAHIKFFECKLLDFYINKKKPINK